MRVIGASISDCALSKHCFILIDKLNLAGFVQLVHDLALSSPDLLASPISRAVSLRTGCWRDLENVDLSFLHKSDFDWSDGAA